MRNRSKKIAVALIIISIVISATYSIVKRNKQDKIAANLNNKEVSMPYINPAWEEYMELSEEEKQEVEIVPPMYTYNYIPVDNMFGDYESLAPQYTLRDEFPTTQYNQENKGICWAYAITTAIESNLKVTQGIDEQFSADYLNYLTAEPTNFIEEYNPYCKYRELNEGNSLSNGLLACGMLPVKLDKFSEPTELPLNITEIANTANLDYTITEATEFPLYSSTGDDVEQRNMLKTYIMKYGAIYVGSMDDYICSFSPQYDVPVSWSLEGMGGLHAYVLIGWDDNQEWRINTNYEGTEAITGRGVWIVQNSWNSGDYVKYVIPYSTTITEMFGIKEIKQKDWDNLYNFADNPNIYYQGNLVKQKGHEYTNMNDKAVTGTMIVSYDKSKYKTEKLNMITFVSASQNGDYDVYISPDGDQNNFQYIKTVTSDLAGMYKVEFDDINLENDKFAVKIHTNNGAISSCIAVYTNDISSSEDELPEIESYIDDGGDISTQYYANKDMCEYHVITYTKNIADSSRFDYTLYDENHMQMDIEIDGSFVDGGRTIGIIKLPKTTELNKKMYVEIICNGEILKTLEFTYNPQIYMAEMEGIGTEESPYVITNEEQLACISNYPSAYYVLGNDIDLSYDKNNYITYNKTAGWKPIYTFSGTLDGQGHSIKNMFIRNSFEEGYIGLFAKVESGTIMNLKIENANVINDSSKFSSGVTTGILAGYMKNSNISNILITGDIQSKTDAGALAGEFEYTNQAIVDKITYVGNITVKEETSYVGSIIGSAMGNELRLSNICVVSKIDTDNLEMYGVGGAIGDCIMGFRINDSYIFSEVNQVEGSLYGNVLGTGDIIYGNNIATYEGVFNHNSSDEPSSPSVSERNTHNIKTYNNMSSFKGTTIESLGFDSSIWEYLPGNPYPTIIGQPYYFESEDEPVPPYEIHTYNHDDTKKTISNIYPATIEHYKENLAIDEPYVVKVFDGMMEVVDGDIATGMTTKIYLDEELVGEYTNIVPGDVYADGKVNSRDAGMIQQYLVGMLDDLYETPQYYAMDFSRDSKVRLNDVELIKRYVIKEYQPTEEDYYGEND